MVGRAIVYKSFSIIHDQRILENKEIAGENVHNKQDIQVLSHYLSTSYQQFVDKLCKSCE